MLEVNRQRADQIDWKYINHVPFSLALRELHRLNALFFFLEIHQSLKNRPILDIGCGDGSWWAAFRKSNEIWGVDISKHEIKLAQQNGINARLHDISKDVPFKGKVFDFVIGNCSLEHIPDIDSALFNIKESMCEDGFFILFVPTPTWALQGKIQKNLLKKFPRVALALNGAVNGFFQHWHLYSAEVWSSLLLKHDLKVEKVFGLGSRKADFYFRLGLFPAFMAFLFKTVFKKYPHYYFQNFFNPLFKFKKNLISSCLEEVVQESDFSFSYEYMIVAKRVKFHD